MGAPLLPLLLVVQASPEGTGDGFGGPFDKGLAQEGGTLEAPVDPGFVATAFGDGRDAGIELEVGSAVVTVTLLAEGDPC